MKCIGIKKSSGIELVDITVEDSSVTTSDCPGALGIACTACSHAEKAGIVNFREGGQTKPPVTFFVCHWHEASPSDGSAASS